MNGADATKTDEVKTSGFGMAINAGIEYRRTKGKLVGYYGPQIALGINSQTIEKTDGVTTDGDASEKTTGGTAFGVKLGGFVGAEYFVAKNISVCGEFGLGVAVNTTSDTKVEYKDGRANATTPGDNSFGLSVGNAAAASLGLNLYF